LLAPWSNDYLCGIEDIDTQHKVLFRMVNEFAAKNDADTQRHVLKVFLDTLESYCASHFSLEEDLMEQWNFPMLELHRDMHSSLKLAVYQMKMHLVDGSLSEPYQNIVNLSVNWLNNHIIKEDQVFATYHKNMDRDLGKFFLGRRCEIMSTNDEFLCEGIIDGVDKSEVSVHSKEGTLALLNVGDAIKALTFADTNEECQAFTANVRSSAPGILRLFGAYAVKQADNQRNFFRVQTRIPGTLFYDGKPLQVAVLDISTGGLMVEVEEDLSLRKVVRIKFNARNHNFEEPCIVTRKINLPNATKNTYGIKFISLGNTQSDWISSFVLQQQAMARRKSETKDIEEEL
jgi:hemerythrin